MCGEHILFKTFLSWLKHNPYVNLFLFYWQSAFVNFQSTFVNFPWVSLWTSDLDAYFNANSNLNDAVYLIGIFIDGITNFPW